MPKPGTVLLLPFDADGCLHHVEFNSKISYIHEAVAAVMPSDASDAKYANLFRAVVQCNTVHPTYKNIFLQSHEVLFQRVKELIEDYDPSDVVVALGSARYRKWHDDTAIARNKTGSIYLDLPMVAEYLQALYPDIKVSLSKYTLADSYAGLPAGMNFDSIAKGTDVSGMVYEDASKITMLYALMHHTVSDYILKHNMRPIVHSHFFDNLVELHNINFSYYLSATDMLPAHTSLAFEMYDSGHTTVNSPIYGTGSIDRNLTRSVRLFSDLVGTKFDNVCPVKSEVMNAAIFLTLRASSDLVNAMSFAARNRRKALDVAAQSTLKTLDVPAQSSVPTLNS
jgi:hypothetical protein